MIRAGTNLMQRIEFPGQRELLPDWDLMVDHQFVPLLEGRYEAQHSAVCPGDEDGLPHHLLESG